MRSRILLICGADRTVLKALSLGDASIQRACKVGASLMAISKEAVGFEIWAGGERVYTTQADPAAGETHP